MHIREHMRSKDQNPIGLKFKIINKESLKQWMCYLNSGVLCLSKKTQTHQLPCNDPTAYIDQFKGGKLMNKGERNSNHTSVSTIIVAPHP